MDNRKDTGIHTLETIYGADWAVQKPRYQHCYAGFTEIYGNRTARFFSAPGRTEVGGNHTDHNHGKVLAAGVSLDVIAAAAATTDNIIEIQSEFFPRDRVDLARLDPSALEINTSAALIRGVAAAFKDRGYKIGGFRAFTTSSVLKGSGLSSSAAFEVLVANILNRLYNNGAVSAVEIAQIAQYAENRFFGKPSGLMDQMASSVGGFITIDFADPTAPVIEEINFDFARSGHRLCIVDTKGSHADLTPEYAAIPEEMKSVARFFGKNFLSELTRDDVVENIAKLRAKCSDRAVLRALHFFDDNDRVTAESHALRKGNFDEFLRLVRASGNSSCKYLQNVFSAANPREQGVSLALYTAKSVLCGRGAYRVHGGGFAGTIQAFVPVDLISEFIARMDAVFGKGSCHVLSIRPVGGTEVAITL
ncbi:MAG: galactokinase family protein [Oscillospiraceae bacterium]